jgi:hypothetical protein
MFFGGKVQMAQNTRILKNIATQNNISSDKRLGLGLGDTGKDSNWVDASSMDFVV